MDVCAGDDFSLLPLIDFAAYIKETDMTIKGGGGGGVPRDLQFIQVPATK